MSDNFYSFQPDYAFYGANGLETASHHVKPTRAGFQA